MGSCDGAFLLGRAGLRNKNASDHPGGRVRVKAKVRSEEDCLLRLVDHAKIAD